MTPQQIKAALIWRPEIAGLEVIEPKTLLEHNLALAEWHKVTKAQVSDMDEMGAYATAHLGELMESK